MKVNYFRERKEHHMVIAAGEIRCPEYQLKMLQKNAVTGVLMPVIRQMDGEVLYDYSITGFHSLQTLAELAPISKALLVALVEDLNRSLDEMERYLVDGDYLALRPEFIYLEKRGENVYRARFCFFPFGGEAPENQMRELLKYVLNEVDYQEKDAVNLAYELFQQASQDDFLIRQLGQTVAELNSDLGESAEHPEITGNTEMVIRECGSYGMPESELSVCIEPPAVSGVRQRRKLLSGRSVRRGREIVLSEILK